MRKSGWKKLGHALIIVITILSLFNLAMAAYGQEVKPMDRTQAIYDSSSKNGRWVQFDGFSQEVAFEFRRFVNFLIDSGAQAVEIQLSNGGGALFAALSMMDDVRYMQENGILVVTRASGLCASACAMLWSQGDIRILGHNSWLMFHSLAISRSGDSHETLHELVENAALLARVQDEINTNLALRLGLSNDVITEIMKRDTWINSTEAIEMGLATQTP